MKIRNEKGVTLLEIMISMLILTIGILGLAPLIGVAIFNNSYANDVTVANALAQKEIESLMLKTDYGTLPYINEKDSVSGVYSVKQRVDDNSITATVPPGLYRLNVNITWTDQSNKSRNVDYSIFKSKQ